MFGDIFSIVDDSQGSDIRKLGEDLMYGLLLFIVVGILTDD